MNLHELIEKTSMSIAGELIMVKKKLNIKLLYCAVFDLSV